MSDIWAAVKVLRSPVNQSLDSLGMLEQVQWQTRVTLLWVTGYVSKERNEDADGAAIVLVKPEPFCGVED